MIKYPFDVSKLPDNGIYFFYEQNETWGHGGSKQRIVRIGTSRDGNFRSRLSEHFLLNASRMNFNATKPAPSERSIFRKKIGSALLNKAGDDYWKIWEKDFTSLEKRKLDGHLRDIQKEKMLELKISKLLRKRFSFRLIIVDQQNKRMGTEGLEKSLIGTVNSCSLCSPSKNWLGNFSPTKQIKESGLWQIQHLKADPINPSARRDIIKTIDKTINWFKR